MKVNETPEKVYLTQLMLFAAPTIRSGDNEIEYIRKDAFVEKAEEFIYSALNDGIMGTANIEDFMRLFEKYMEE